MDCLLCKGLSVSDTWDVRSGYRASREGVVVGIVLSLAVVDVWIVVSLLTVGVEVGVVLTKHSSNTSTGNIACHCNDKCVT